ncbi:hypothetical protein RIR_jg42556.t1 [Rhizophagus irregularis DAOM 181602=DAOM 197198]|nr:hypothetical protein RIR_jg42556.t1 [Rhizophagus irregularis DAOM 181602=DAOM 197198]
MEFLTYIIKKLIFTFKVEALWKALNLIQIFNIYSKQISPYEEMESSRHLFKITPYKGQRFITETTTAVSIQLAIYNWREGKGLYYLERLSSYIQLDPKWYHRVTT